jgi:hypothetical protein
MYISVRLQDDQIKKLEKWARLSATLSNNVMNKSIKRAIELAKEMEKEDIASHYTVEDGPVSQGLKVKVVGDEGMLLAAAKKSAVQKFDISMKKPGRSTSRLSAVISKASGRHTMRTMFWAFYKSGGNKFGPGLYKRTGDERDKITPFRTVSVSGMTQPLTQAQLDRIEKIFFDELSSRLKEI